MEIINSLDSTKSISELEGEDVLSTGDGVRLKITDIRQGVKNPERVNVFVNGKFAFSLDIAQVVDLKIKVGKEITAEELEEYKKQSNFGKLYQRTLEWVLMRPRSIRETRDYLRRKFRNFPSDTQLRAPSASKAVTSCAFSERPSLWSSEEFSELQQDIVSKLCSKGYLDDVKFAEYYVENRFVKKGISRKRLKMELMKKGVDAETIERVLDGRNDEEEILKIIAKKRAKYDDEKLIAYLCRQGFPYQLVQSLVANHEKD